MSNLYSVYNNIDRPLIPIIASMMDRGMPFSIPSLDTLRPTIESRKESALESCWREAGYPFNPGSGPQIADLLFNYIGLPIPDSKTKSGGIPTDGEVLSLYLSAHPVVQPIINYKRYDKLLDGFIYPLPKYVSSDSRIHCNFSLTTAVTGRLASSEPNLMNIPARRSEGRELRDCFISRPGYSFLSCDLSQIELRVAAHYSQDTDFMEAFLTGQDIHSRTAITLFGTDEGEKRHIAKTINFAILYGISAQGLYENLMKEVPTGNWTVEMCQGFLDSYLSSHHGISRYISDTRAFARRNGYVETLFGRRRNASKVYAATKKIVEAGLRESVNLPIQGTAADIIKLQMQAVSRLITDMSWEEEVLLLLQIHDDLVFEVRDDMVEVAAGAISTTMSETVPLSVPVLVGVKAGSKWGSMEKVCLN